jgi:hypothetical protein
MKKKDSRVMRTIRSGAKRARTPGGTWWGRGHRAPEEGGNFARGASDTVLLIHSRDRQ